MSPRLLSLAAAALAVVPAILSSCASPAGVTTGGAVTKVKYQHLDPTRPLISPDPAIPFEARYRNHGAIHPKEFQQRHGYYYAAFWRVDDQSKPTTVRFEYRQTNSEDTTFTQEVTVQPGRRNLTHFEITGPPYRQNGAVTAHRVLVLQDGQVVASHNSFLWK